MRNKDDYAIISLSTSLSYMIYNACYDMLDFKMKRIIRLYANMIIQKERFENGDVTREGLLAYCDKKGISIAKYIKMMPQRQRLQLAGKNITVMTLAYIDQAMLLNLAFMVATLKETFRVSNANIEVVLEKIVYYVDSYTRKQPGLKECYLNDEMIISIFKDELGLDIEKGEIL